MESEMEKARSEEIQSCSYRNEVEPFGARAYMPTLLEPT
jgi:hypothetical protein